MPEMWVFTVSRDTPCSSAMEPRLQPRPIDAQKATLEGELESGLTF